MSFLISYTSSTPSQGVHVRTLYVFCRYPLSILVPSHRPTPFLAPSLSGGGYRTSSSSAARPCAHHAFALVAGMSNASVQHDRSALTTSPRFAQVLLGRCRARWLDGQPEGPQVKTPFALDIKQHLIRLKLEVKACVKTHKGTKQARPLAGWPTVPPRFRLASS